MNLREGEQVVLEVRRSWVTWCWPILKSVWGGALVFGFFWGFLYLLDSGLVTYDAKGAPAEASHWFSLKNTNMFFANRELRAGAMIGALLLVGLVVKLAFWLRRRRRAKMFPPQEATPEVPDLTSELSEGALRRIAVRRMVRYFRVEKLIITMVLLGVLAFFLLVLKLSLFFQETYTAAIFYGVATIIAMLVYRYICWSNTVYCLTDRRFFTLSGWFSKNTWEIPLSECRHIEGKRNFFQKMFGYGHLTIAGVGSISEYLAYVPKPDRFREAIRSALDAQAGSPVAEPASDPSEGGEASPEPVDLAPEPIAPIDPVEPPAPAPEPEPEEPVASEEPEEVLPPQEPTVAEEPEASLPSETLGEPEEPASPEADPPKADSNGWDDPDDDPWK